MFKFGKRSLKNLSQCHSDLQLIANELIKEMDVAVICGHRTEEEQEKAFKGGFSKLRFPNSKHNKQPSLAVDIVPYPVDWNDIERFNDMCDRVERIAQKLDIEIRLGRSFSFKDYPHIELVGAK